MYYGEDEVNSGQSGCRSYRIMCGCPAELGVVVFLGSISRLLDSEPDENRVFPAMALHSRKVTCLSLGRRGLRCAP